MNVAVMVCGVAGLQATAGMSKTDSPHVDHVSWNRNCQEGNKISLNRVPAEFCLIPIPNFAMRSFNATC